ncbi:DUF4157 domain-containing protein [Intrasporangium sp.]|uniref:eCIS core domain-containing protein n=1 Tax=Intrasporangium sp. TaxID=1925024 RepID=UPI0032221E5B
MFVLRRRTSEETEARDTARRVVRAGERGTDGAECEVPARPRRRHGPAGAAASALGLPLGDPERRSLEQGFQVDLSQVRIRPRDEPVARRGAHAETRGATIAFAPGAYAPHTRAGRELLAHEIAHVLQQAVTRSAATASDKAPATKVYYQQVVDEFNSAWGPHEAAIRPVLALFEAVEREDGKAVPALVTALGTVDAYILPPEFPANPVLDELLTRLVLLGLPTEATRVRDWYVKLPGLHPYGQQRFATRYYDDEEWHWNEVLHRLRDRVDWKDAAVTLHVLDGLVTFFHLLEAERAGLDPVALKADRKRLEDLYQALGGLGVGFELKPFVSIARYHSSLRGMMQDSFVGMQAAFQAVLELATAQLTAKRGHALLDALEAKHTAVAARIRLPAGSNAAIEINEWAWRKRRDKDILRQVDFFPDDKSAARREITLESYDELDTTSGPSKQLDAERIIAIRTSQLAALRRIYGLQTEQGRPTAEAKENQAAAATLGAGGLHLHSDEDWRRFLRAKFEAHLVTSRNADESLAAVIELLGAYLHSFTTHSPMNIEDFGDDLLRVQFPRALTGQLVHDCGVYALRITYMLSLLRDHPALKLRFRWVQLPVHIGLIVTGAPDISMWIVHNDQFSRGDPQFVAETRRKWEALDRQGKQKPPPRPGDKPKKPTKAEDDQFVGELAANEFVEGTDMPFVITDVPRLGGTNAKLDKDRLWAFYRSLMTVRLFGKTTDDPSSDAYQFHLKYLEVLDKTREHYNTWLVPYWNVLGFTAWSRSRQRLERADTALKAAGTPDAHTKATAEFDAATRAYLDLRVGDRGFTLVTGLAKLVEQFAPIRQLAQQINDAIAAKPEILAKGVSKASAIRAAEALGGDEPWWQREVDAHIDALKQHRLSIPPFADKADHLPVVD